MEFPGLLLPEPFRQVFPSDHRDDSFSVSDEAKPAGGKDSRAAVKDLCITEYDEGETLQMIREEGDLKC